MKKLILIACIGLFVAANTYGLMRTVQRTTGTGAMSVSDVKGDTEGKLLEVRLHLSSAGGTSENFVVYIDSGVSSVYDTVLFSENMLGVQDVVFRPIPGAVCRNNSDALKFTYTNTDANSWGLERIYE